METDIIGRPLRKGTFVLYTTATRSNEITLGILREDMLKRERNPFRSGTCKVIAIKVQTIAYDRELREYVELTIPRLTSRKTTLHHIPYYAVDPYQFVPKEVLPEVLELQRSVLESD